MQPSADDLLVLLTLSRRRTFVAAAAELVTSHTTVARRVQRLEKAVGSRLLVETARGWSLTPLGEELCAAARSIEEALAGLDSRADAPRLRGLVRITAPEIFMREVVAPAVSGLAQANPDLQLELVSVTRSISTQGTSGDIDVSVTQPPSRRLVSQRVADYDLGLFASASYLADREPISNRADLQDHTPIYYVDSMLHVNDLDLLGEVFPSRRPPLGATSVIAQLALVEAGAGIGLLPTYAVRNHPLVERVLETDATASLSYWLTSRPDALRRPAVRATASAIALEANRRIPIRSES